MGLAGSGLRAAAEAALHSTCAALPAQLWLRPADHYQTAAVLAALVQVYRGAAASSLCIPAARPVVQVTYECPDSDGIVAAAGSQDAITAATEDLVACLFKLTILTTRVCTQISGSS